MKLDSGANDSDVQTLLERGRAVRRLPEAVRARALARARAAIVAEPRVMPLADVSVGAHRFRLALAASVAVAVGAAGAAAALRTSVFSSRHAAPAPAIAAPVADPVIEPEAVEPAPAIRAERSGRFATAQESYRAEVALLQRAQAAYADRNFSVALALVGEHGRRFPKGRLAEEREALRVRSLASAGRTGEARRAAAQFEHRFPRSVLLPRLRETVSAAR